jgi:3-oxoisoapionate kinase
VIAPKLAFYGDDFTGSADVMEVLQWSGIKTMLFVEPPTIDQLSEIDGLEAFGIAGTSRSMSPAEMDVELTEKFNCLKDSGASIIHYKTCSTFDSSPKVGSIGRAIEIGRKVFGNRPVPVVIGAPKLGRYQAFGNLFARSGLDSVPHRLDRHPTMSQHPITPMNEADLCKVLATQTKLSTQLIDVTALDGSNCAIVKLAMNDSKCDIVLFDVMNDDHLAKIGCVIDEESPQKEQRFVVGSSGVEYALTAAWRPSRMIADRVISPSIAPLDRLLVITGSCSPVNDRQITWAEQHGFQSLAIDTAKLVHSVTCDEEVDRVVQQASTIIETNPRLVIHSSRGPSDQRMKEVYAAMRDLGWTELDTRLKSGQIIGPQLGRILNQLLQLHPFDRIGVAGGDTSGFIAKEIGVIALEAIAPVAPGSPLCKIHSKNVLNGKQIIFKGGQVGKDDVWGTVLGVG